MGPPPQPRCLRSAIAVRSQPCKPAFVRLAVSCLLVTLLQLPSSMWIKWDNVHRILSRSQCPLNAWCIFITMVILENLPEEAANLARLMGLRGPLGVILSLLLFYKWGTCDSESLGDFSCETSLYHLSLWGSEDVLILKGETSLQQPKCPTTNEGLDNLWYIYTTDYSTIKGMQLDHV